MLVIAILLYVLIWVGFGSYVGYDFWSTYQYEKNYYESEQAKERYQSRIHDNWKHACLAVTKFTTISWFGIALCYLAMIGIQSLLK